MLGEHFGRRPDVGFSVLTADGDDGARWSTLVAALPPEQRDIHFLPDYGRIYEKTYGHRPFLAIYSDEKNFVLQPFVRRRLNDLPFLREQGIVDPYCDISNPYGYGGPLSSCNATKETVALCREFDRHFCAYCKDERIASEFTSLHPLIGNHLLVVDAGYVVPDRQKEIVYVDLTVPEEELWHQINRGNRSSINKARRRGVHIEKEPMEAGNLALFNRLYYQTMRRNKAADRWFFPEDYFRNCLDSLGEERVSLFIAFVDGVPASAYFLLHDYATVYYHFGGSDERFFELRPNNLLMYEVVLWAKRNGFLRYHLGGGVSSTADDPLLHFKAGFSTNRATLFTYSRIHHQPTYNRLCELKQSHERATIGEVTKSDYFPRYRR